MSTNIYESDKLIITSFYGGQERGRMIQITALETKEKGVSYCQLDQSEVSIIARKLIDWILNQD